MMRAIIVAAIIMSAGIMSAGPAQAHKLKVFAAADGAAITGTVYFTGGAKAQGAKGVVTAPDNSQVAQFTTDADGGFRFDVAARMDHTITVDAGDGHVAGTVVTAGDLAPSLPQGQSSARPADAAAPAQQMDAVEAAVARQILPLRRQLDEYEDRIRLHDILGGLGTVLGLFGALAWVQARRRP